MGLWLIFLIGAVALILGGAVYVWLWIGEQH